MKVFTFLILDVKSAIFVFSSIRFFYVKIEILRYVVPKCYVVLIFKLAIAFIANPKQL